jgi:hypothetical protein
METGPVAEVGKDKSEVRSVIPACGLGAHTLYLGGDKGETLNQGRESLRNSPPTTCSSRCARIHQRNTNGQKKNEMTYVIRT